MKKLFALILTLALIWGLLTISGSAEELETGDIVTFGTYEQDNKKSNGAEDIQWIVLGVTSDKESVLLLSRYCLDCVPFHDKQKAVTWEDSYLRQWLNEDFLCTAFSPAEQARLKTFVSDMEANPVYGTGGGNDTYDHVTLLSIQEAERIFKNDDARCCDATAYAKAQGTQVYSTGAWWRLRSPGRYDTGVTSVYASGKIAYEGDTMWDWGCGIRPMILVDIT